MMPLFRRKAPLGRGLGWGLGPLSAVLLMLLLGSCSRLLGWGVLLWSQEDPAIPSGTVLPVYIRSNIDKVWVVGIPENYRRAGSNVDKIEIPLSQLEFAGGKGKARARAAEFSPLALRYAETLQDGLPIRLDPDNSSRRVYRLRQGEVIKILERVEGNPAISTTGAPLPGDWYLVLAEDGSTGYCFSYRLNIFDYSGGPLAAAHVVPEEEDPELEKVLAKTWSPDSYGSMVAERKIDLDDLSRKWFFNPGIDAGLAHIYLPSLDRSFPYTAIRSAGKQAWRFEGTSLQMNLRPDAKLTVQYTEENGILQTLLFVELPSGVDDLIIQETARRDELFDGIYTQGPEYISNNYGVLSFREDSRFNWTGYDLLTPRIIPLTAGSSGRVSMDLFLAETLTDRYNGAFSLIFDGLGGPPAKLHFMYTMDAQGFRLEHVPDTSLNGATVLYRASSPTVLYFYKTPEPSVLDF
ncbi:lipoprotein [Spirochaetia bacterium]|nr:lipoprotein [Spirochaetia bacterium]